MNGVEDAMRRLVTEELLPFSLSAASYLVYEPDADYNAGDSLVYQVDDGQSVSGPTKFDIHFYLVDDIPVIADVSASVLEDSVDGVSITLEGIDTDSTNTAILITHLPSKGKLFFLNHRGQREEIQAPFRLEPLATVRQHAVSVLNVSSFWAAGLPANETACPPGDWNAAAQCAYPRWHPFQILGPQSVSFYGDSIHSFATATMLGGEHMVGGDKYINFSYSPSQSFDQEGYTEFIEIGFETMVFVSQITVGENRGAGKPQRD